MSYCCHRPGVVLMEFMSWALRPSYRYRTSAKRRSPAARGYSGISICAVLLTWSLAACPCAAETAAAPRPLAVTTRIDFVEFSGNASVSGAVLQDAVKPWLGRDLSVAQMNVMAEAVSGLYRKRGYMVATAYVAAQTVRDRTLKITIVEGVFSEVAVRSNTSRVPDATILRTLSVNLCGQPTGCRGAWPVRNAAVERAGLLATELPGVRVTYELAAGQEDGSTSVFADVTAAPRLSGTAGIDNGGLAFTGRWRAALSAKLSNLLDRGDVTSLSATYSGKGFASFVVDTSLPVASRGLRVGASASHVRYALGREFSVLEATGVSDAAGLYASYPLARAFDRSADLRAEVVGKRIRNSIGVVNLNAKATTTQGILTLTGSRLDPWLGTGSTQVRLALTAGDLRLRDPLTRRFDTLTAKTAGTFGKAAYLLSREQGVRPGWTAFAQISGQVALNNLDSSEKFGLTGPQGVRAYVSGAVAADTAALVTAESRLSVPAAWTPGHQVVLAPFYDYGWAQLNADNWAGYGGPRSVELSGGGVYLSVVAPGRYAMKAGVAMRQGTPNALPPGSREQFWLEAAVAF